MNTSRFRYIRDNNTDHLVYVTHKGIMYPPLLAVNGNLVFDINLYHLLKDTNPTAQPSSIDALNLLEALIAKDLEYGGLTTTSVVKEAITYIQDFFYQP